MEDGVREYLVSRGASPSSIKIQSVLSTPSSGGWTGSGSIVDLPSAAIVTLTDVDANNKTVVDASAAEEKMPTAEELAAGAAALAAEIAKGQQELVAGDGIVAQGVRSVRRVSARVEGTGGGEGCVGGGVPALLRKAHAHTDG